MTQDQVGDTIWRICDIMRRSNYSGALGYLADLSWLLFLRLLDEREERDAERNRALGLPVRRVLSSEHRWRSWAAPGGQLRQRLAVGERGGVINFVNDALLPYLRTLGDRRNATPLQKAVSEVVSGVSEIGIDGQKNLLDVLDLIHTIRIDQTDRDSVFALSQAYERLLLEMGQTNKDAGQFFTARVVVRALVKAVDPQFGETVYDPCCGSGGFLVQAYEHMREKLGWDAPAPQLETLARKTFYGREKADLVYPICVAQLALHGIDEPHIWHGNTLTRVATYDGLFENAPAAYDVILMNPPFGGKEGVDAQDRFVYKSRETQLLFLQDVIDSLADGGRAGMVIDEGTLFKSTNVHVGVRQKLLDECDLECVVSLASGAFAGAGSGVKTNLLIFNKGRATKSVWYYDVAPPRDAPGAGGSGQQRTFTKRYPLTLAHFDEFFKLLPTRADSENSWTVSREQIDANNYDLKAVNPNRPTDTDTDTRTPAELLEEIEAHGRELAAALADLRQALRLEE